MYMYFVQHGEALPKDVDPERGLSENGSGQVRRIANYLQRAGLQVSEIRHSGKTRARQTAELFAAGLGDPGVSEIAGMNPNDDVAVFAGGSLQDGVMYVGHLPHMGKLVSYLTTGDPDADVIRFTNGGVVCLQQEEAGTQISWYIRPADCIG